MPNTLRKCRTMRWCWIVSVLSVEEVDLFCLKRFFYFADFSCALVGDILLQGYLYITQNYFAFYSNVFGYVTKVGCAVPVK